MVEIKRGGIELESYSTPIPYLCPSLVCLTTDFPTPPSIHPLPKACRPPTSFTPESSVFLWATLLTSLCRMCRGAALAPAPATTVPPSASGPGPGAALRQPRLRPDWAPPGGGCTRRHSRVWQVPQVPAWTRPSPGCLSTPARLQPQLPAAGISTSTLFCPLPLKYTGCPPMHNIPPAATLKTITSDHNCFYHNFQTAQHIQSRFGICFWSYLKYFFI